MSEETPTYATTVENGKIAVINGTSCSGYCTHPENDCGFPDCATFSGEEFDTVEQAKITHPNLVLV